MTATPTTGQVSGTISWPSWWPLRSKAVTLLENSHAGATFVSSIKEMSLLPSLWSDWLMVVLLGYHRPHWPTEWQGLLGSVSVPRTQQRAWHTAAWLTLTELLIGPLRHGIERYRRTNVGSHWDGKVPLMKGCEEEARWAMDKGFHAVSGAMDTPSPCPHWTNRATSECESQAPHHCHRPFYPFTVGQVFLCTPSTSIHSPILKTIISSLLAMSLNQTLKTADLGPKALASSEICVNLMYTQFEFHVLLVSHIPVCFSQEFRAGTQSHGKPLSTPIFTPQLTTLFLFYRVLFLTWPLIPKSSPTGRSSRWTWRMQYAVTRGPGMAVTVATTLKPVHRAHLPTHSRPFMWVTSLFPAGSQTCLRTPSSSFLDGPRYVSSWKVFAFRPQMSSFLCLIQHQKDC